MSVRITVSGVVPPDNSEKPPDLEPETVEDIAVAVGSGTSQRLPLLLPNPCRRRPCINGAAFPRALLGNGENPTGRQDNGADREDVEQVRLDP